MHGSKKSLNRKTIKLSKNLKAFLLLIGNLAAEISLLLLCLKFIQMNLQQALRHLMLERYLSSQLIEVRLRHQGREALLLRR